MNQVAVGFDRGVWRQKAQASVPRVLAGAAAVVLTVAAFLYVRIALASAAQGSAMALRTRFVLVVLILSATSTCLHVLNGFNLIWIFSFAGCQRPCETPQIAPV